MGDRLINVGLVLETEKNNGGIHQYSMMLFNALNNHNNSSINFVGICLNDTWKTYCENRNVKYYVPRNQYYDNNVLKRYCYAYIDLIHSFVVKKNDYLDCKANKIDICIFTKPTQLAYLLHPSVKVICPIHDLMDIYESRFDEVGSFYEKKARYIINSRIVRWCDCILTDSMLGKKQVEEVFLRGNSNKKVLELPYIAPDYILDWNQIQEDDDWKLIKAKLPDKYFFYPAQFWNHKNHIGILKAIRELKYEFRDICIVFCGSHKNAYSDVIKYINENGLINNVIILDYVSNYSMIKLYQKTVGLVMPSFFGPTNIPQLEAFVLGCPVAVANVYAVAEQVGDAALLFDPYDYSDIAKCMKILWNDENARNRLILAGNRKTKKWNRDSFSKKLLSIITEVCRYD